MKTKINTTTWLLLLLFFASILQAAPAITSTFEKAQPISNQTCIDCHQTSHQQWKLSDHAKSMALPNNANILADFNNTLAKHYGQTAKFYKKGDQYFVDIAYDNNSQTLPIKYTFGHYPLQQYLVETEKGRLQVLPFAWDSRAKSEGGQRWYHNYSEEEIKPADRLHWRQPLQNWNGMCADCHSDGLVRRFDAENNQFASQFDNINVGCLSCHGNMSSHGKAQGKSTTKVRNTVSKPLGSWVRSIGDKTAHWQGEKRDNSFMDGCFACHSLRSPLTDGFKANKPFLDQFTPQLPAAPNYHADGQIKEEVYVYGSFLQSKMFAAGVNCLDCHDKHTMKLKDEGNGLCLQCHGAEVYNVKSHHQHEDNSVGAQCANCHMPENRYMGVDDRRDHSFKIPRPDLSLTFNTPNACTKCHDDKSNQWANENLTQWHGAPKELLRSKQFLIELNSGKPINLEEHLTIIADTNLDVISRASALQMLSFTTQTITIEILKPYLQHQEPLLRLSAATIGTLLPPTARVLHISSLLSDKFKAVRVAAARALLTDKIANTDQTTFDAAFKELAYANSVNSWRGEGMANIGVMALETNQPNEATKSFIKAIEIEPYFEAAYINLADIYRAQQKPFQVNSVLSKGIKNNPTSANLHYSYGLYFVRQKKLSKAINLFEKAMFLMPENSQYAYTLVLAIDGEGKSQHALAELKALIGYYQDNAQLKELGLYLSQKVQSKSDYDWFMKL